MALPLLKYRSKILLDLLCCLLKEHGTEDGPRTMWSEQNCALNFLLREISTYVIKRITHKNYRPFFLNIIVFNFFWIIVVFHYSICLILFNSLLIKRKAMENMSQGFSWFQTLFVQTVDNESHITVRWSALGPLSSFLLTSWTHLSGEFHTACMIWLKKSDLLIPLAFHSYETANPSLLYKGGIISRRHLPSRLPTLQC